MPHFPCFRCPRTSSLVGIARLAAEGESLREGHNVEYFTLPARSLLNRCTSNRNMPFTWTINPYRGCEFGCHYCYARYTHEFMEMRDGMEFEQKIYVKQHAAELLRHDLRRVKPGESIALGTATDPYQPAERRYEITRRILEEFARHRGFELGIVTKSNLIVRDMDLLREISRRTIDCRSILLSLRLNAELARILEPRAPRPDLRIDAVRAAQRRGNYCWRELFAGSSRHHRFASRSRGAGARGGRGGSTAHLRRTTVSEAVFGSSFSSLSSSSNFPHLVENYRQRYQDRSFLPGFLRQTNIGNSSHSFVEKYGIKRADPRGETCGQMAGAMVLRKNSWHCFREILGIVQIFQFADFPIVDSFCNWQLESDNRKCDFSASSIITPLPWRQPPLRASAERVPFRVRMQHFWRRVSEGMELTQLWSQFETEARASYRLYSRDVAANTPEGLTRRGHRLHVVKEFFWAVLEKLSPARRVLLLAALVLLVFPSGGFSYHGSGNDLHVVELDFHFFGGLLLFLLLMLEIADRVVMKRDLQIAREIQTWLLPGAPPQIPGLSIAYADAPRKYRCRRLLRCVSRVRARHQEESRVIFAVADVAGKSIPAAMLMATFQASLKTLSTAQVALPELVGEHEQICLLQQPGRIALYDRFSGGVRCGTARLHLYQCGA